VTESTKQMAAVRQGCIPSPSCSYRWQYGLH